MEITLGWNSHLSPSELKASWTGPVTVKSLIKSSFNALEGSLSSFSLVFRSQLFLPVWSKGVNNPGVFLFSNSKLVEYTVRIFIIFKLQNSFMSHRKRLSERDTRPISRPIVREWGIYLKSFRLRLWEESLWTLININDISMESHTKRKPEMRTGQFVMRLAVRTLNAVVFSGLEAPLSPHERISKSPPCLFSRYSIWGGDKEEKNWQALLQGSTATIRPNNDTPLHRVASSSCHRFITLSINLLFSRVPQERRPQG